MIQVLTMENKADVKALWKENPKDIKIIYKVFMQKDYNDYLNKLS